LKIMGQNLKKYTRNLFLWDHIVKRHLELFARISNNRGQSKINAES